MSNNNFKPQGTTLNSFQHSESIVNNFFASKGFEQETSKAVARVFTQYMLNYLTFEGAVNIIANSGISLPEARRIVQIFERSRKQYVMENIAEAPASSTQ